MSKITKEGEKYEGDRDKRGLGREGVKGLDHQGRGWRVSLVEAPIPAASLTRQ